jgi:hypothetical protein
MGPLCSTTEDISNASLKPKVHYRVHNSPQQISTLSQMNASHSVSWRFSLILFSHLRLVLPSDLFPSGFCHLLFYALLGSPVHATCHVHPIILDSIMLMIFVEECNLSSPSLCSFLHHWACIAPGVCLGNLFSDILKQYSLFRARPSFAPEQNSRPRYMHMGPAP